LQGLKVLDNSGKGSVHGRDGFVYFGLFVGTIAKHCASCRDSFTAFE
jgi:hypothetical protein